MRSILVCTGLLCSVRGSLKEGKHLCKLCNVVLHCLQKCNGYCPLRTTITSVYSSPCIMNALHVPYKDFVNHYHKIFTTLILLLFNTIHTVEICKH